MSIFAFSPVRKQSRSQIPMNKMHTTTTDFFRWDVSFFMDLVAKDIVSLNIKSFVDSAPNPFPINGSASYGMYAFFIPNRLVWKDWMPYKEQLQEGLTPPYFTIGDLVDAFHSPDNPWREDYFDVAAKYIGNIDNLASIIHFVYDYSAGTAVPSNWRNLKLSAMPLRKVNRAWFDWMRDKVHISDNALDSYCKDTGGHITQAELISLCAPRYRCYPKNYFTTCFDSPQEGGAIVSPVGLASDELNPGLGTTSENSSLAVLSDSSKVYKAGKAGIANNIIGQQSVNDLRLATAKQQLMERLLLAGKTRLSRALALFNTAPTIEELQMTNYLGGHEEDLLFKSSMVGTTSSAVDSPRQAAGAFGYNPNDSTIAGQKFQTIVTGSDDGIGLKDITYKTDESGSLIVMGCIIPHVQYFQGLPRNWTRGLDTLNSDVTDFFHSDFENQPLQPVLNYEICASDVSITPKSVYGFNLMYSDYKQLYDSIGGDFLNPRSSNLMKSMHLGRDIGRLCQEIADAEGIPVNSALTPANITQSTGFDVSMYDEKFTISSPSLDHFIVNHKITVMANRPMQKYCLPSLDSSLSALTPKDMVETGGMRL